MEQFENTAKIKQAFQKFAPQKLAFSCIYPSYGKYDWASGRYPIYVDTYLKTVDPPILSMDYYPYTDKNSQMIGNNLWQEISLSIPFHILNPEQNYHGLGLWNVSPLVHLSS